MERNLCISSLPDEVLIQIFEFCDISSLSRLELTCKRFKNLIKNEENIWHHKSLFVLGSNMKHPDMKKRCKPILSYRRRCVISRRWKEGNAEMNLVRKYVKCLPWLRLESDILYCSTGNSMLQIARDENGDMPYMRNSLNFRLRCADITKFVVHGKELIVAFTDGWIGKWNKEIMKQTVSIRAHESEIFSIDAREDIIISGSRDRKIKVWKSQAYSKRIEEVRRINMDVRVLSLAFVPSYERIIAGLSGTNEIHPLQLLDLERGSHIVNFGETFKHGAGILGIHPEDANTFLCCGYDTTVRLWDIRCPKTWRRQWMDPYDNSIYCLSSDKNVTIVHGATNGFIHIWDKRHSKPVIQLYKHVYYPSERSPVFCVDFDASHIVSAYSKGIVEHQFNWNFSAMRFAPFLYGATVENIIIEFSLQCETTNVPATFIP